jgi:hypothetical protein
MNFALGLAANRIPGIQVNLEKLGASSSDDPMRLMKALSLTDLSEQTRAAIAADLEQNHAAPHMAGLILGSPEFQRK